MDSGLVTQVSTFRRPRWRDPRLGIGVLLVAISVAIGAWVFAQADQTIPVYRAHEAVPVGEHLNEASLELINVNLSGAHDSYLAAEEFDSLIANTEGSLFVRAVPAGELIPRSAIGSSGDLDLRPVSVTVANTAPIQVGSVVDLWAMAEDLTGREVTEPELIATGLHVRAIAEDDSIFAAANDNVVQVLVPEEEVGRVLAALGSTSNITLVPQLGG